MLLVAGCRPGNLFKGMSIVRSIKSPPSPMEQEELEKTPERRRASVVAKPTPRPPQRDSSTVPDAWEG